MVYKVNVEHFEGPLDLLLQLVERNELEVSKISLAGVADQFVQYMQNQSVPPEELADFLVIATKLVYMKSKLLMPDFSDDEAEEGPDLETQLRQYQMFVVAAKRIDEKWKLGERSFQKIIVPIRRHEISFSPPPGVTVEILKDAMERVIKRIEPIVRLPKVAIKRAVSIHERIRDLFTRIKTHAKMTFNNFISHAENKEDAIVSFLALLELVKQKFVVVNQGDIFQDIDISHNPNAPKQDPLAESFT